MKTYTVVMTRYRNGNAKTLEFVGTVPELIEEFKYTLDCGKDYEHERGNKKINTEPKTIKSLITNLNNAENNCALNGYSGVSYSIKM